MGDWDGGWQGGGRSGRGGYRGGGYQPRGRGGGRYDQGGYQGGGQGGGYQGDYYQQQGGGYQGGGYRGGRGAGGGAGAEYQGESRGGFYDNDFNNSWRGGGRGGGRRGGRYQGNWGRGRGGRDDGSRRKRDEDIVLPPDVQFYKEVPAHDKKLTSMVVDSAAKMIYTGSADGSVKCWSAESGQCVTTVDVGGSVTAMLLSGGFLFVAINKLEEGIIKVYNLASGQNHQLPGHKGEIYCLLAAGGVLFSAGQDRSVRVWNFNPQAGIFMSQAIITKDEGGHDAPVHCLQTAGNFVFSADRLGCLKVWDLTSGACAQTLQHAHQEGITNMLMWENFLLTTSMDGLVKIWEVLAQPMPNMVLKPETVYAFDKEKESRDDVQQQSRPNQYRRPEASRIFFLAGTLDASGSPVLMLAYDKEPFIRLYEVPTFVNRGVLTPTPDPRSLSMMLSPEGRGHIMMVGDGSGKLRIFGWNAMAAVAALPGAMQ